MRRLFAGLLTVLCLGLLISFGLIVKRPAKGGFSATLTQTYIALKPSRPVSAPGLITANGSVLLQKELQGHWSVIFFGFTACPLVCPRTLGVLSAVARNPESGVSSGATRLVFVSVDTARDTPESVSSYLAHFDRHILGLTGGRDAIDRFSREIGAESPAVQLGIDHSTSLFVLDPKGRLAGVLLRPSDQTRIIGDLRILRRLYGDALI